MNVDIIKGSDEDIKHKSENAKLPLEVLEDNMLHPKYIIFDLKLTQVRTY